LREARADAAELHGAAQELPLHAAAVGRVVRERAVAVAVGDGAVAPAPVQELGREYRSVGDLAPEPVALLEDHAEGIARMQIEGEVDVPSEDLREREDQRIGESGLLPRVVE